MLGALIAGQFGSTIDANVADANLSPAADAAVEEAKSNPLVPPDTGDLPPQEAERVDAAATDGAESAFHLAMVVNGVLMIIGGIVAGFGIREPEAGRGADRAARRARRRVRPLRGRRPRRAGPRARAAEPASA